MTIDTKAAKRKLQHAEFLLANLKSLSKDIALDMRRRVDADYSIPLEAYFTGCLGAARSCYFLLCTKGPLKRIESNWRNTALDQHEREKFNRIVHLRDSDVHHGVPSGEILATMVEAESHETNQFIQYNAAIFGPQSLAEHVNPDGATVKARSLHGTYALYVDISSQRIEASDTCSWFLAKLRTLILVTEQAITACDSTK